MTTPHDKALEAATKAWMDDRGIDSDISRWRDSIDIAISAYLSSIGGVVVPPAYNNCTCDCHRGSGKIHIVACCHPPAGLSALNEEAGK